MQKKNLVHQGHILQVTGTIGTKGFDLCTAMLASQNRRLKEWRANSAEHMSHMVAAASASEVNDGPSDAHRHAATEYLRQGDPKGYGKLFIHQESINMAKRFILPVVIRRTGTSRAPDGNTILNLKPYVESTVWVVPREDEHQMLRRLYNEYVNNSEQGSVIFPFYRFYCSCALRAELPLLFLIFIAGDCYRKSHSRTSSCYRSICSFMHDSSPPALKRKLL